MQYLLKKNQNELLHKTSGGAHIEADIQADEATPSSAERRPPKIASSAATEIDWSACAKV
ncbi:hypothetical protein F443_04197 [Phytophthora nicotianae P1569]|uniref:Uncharacterized protein n=2 Tax=Phytophthora nicotianae TaxID=4792 RepID=V9FNT7_PHYNI|nr:hypothetical protein F443_04197 [Phytophthora nicotianae P1569]ETO81414.1 hypothetical protein F444_04249 [Phytophthora nicotianae P1976]